jgi:hypothetical protein
MKIAAIWLLFIFFEPITLLLSDLVLLQLEVCNEEGCVLLADGYV